MHPNTKSLAILYGGACPHGPFPICACAKYVARSKLSDVITATSTSTSDQSANAQRTEQSSIPSESSLLERLEKLRKATLEDGGETVVPMENIFEDPDSSPMEIIYEDPADADAGMESDADTAVATDSEDDPEGFGPVLSRCDSQSTGTGARSKWQTEYRARRGSGVTEAPGSELRVQEKDDGSQSGASEVGTGAGA